jgi:HSP20 family protein
VASRGRWDPFREIAALQNELGRMAAAGREAEPVSRTWAPLVDVWETDSDLVFAFEVPGVPSDKISIELDDGALTVSGEREPSEQVSNDRYYRLERRYGPFSRTINVPPGVADSDVNADYADGVLEVRIAKPQAPQPKRIEIGKKKK